MEAKTYVRVIDGMVVEVIAPAFWPDSGEFIPVEQRYTHEFVETLVDVTALNPMPTQWWTYDGSVFLPPAPPAPPTPAQILAANTATRNQYLAAATLAIAPLQDAVDIGEATPDDEAMLLKWKQFRVAVNRVVLTLTNPVWPVPPQPGYGAAVAPVQSES